LTLLFFILAAGTVGGALACVKSRDAALGERAARISQGSDLLSFDPYFKLESPSFNIQRNVFDALTDVDANMKLAPGLAERWELKSPTVWEFTLRRGVTFHGGQPFSADDAVYSIRRAMDWKLSRVKSEIPTVRRVEALGGSLLRVETTMPDAILPLRLASILILNRASCEPAVRQYGDDWLATHANGTGPYRVLDWRKDVRCELIANDRFWGRKPTVRRLDFIPTSSDATRLTALHGGDIDLMINVPPAFVDYAARVGGYRILKRPGLRLIYLGLDVGRDKTPGVAASPPNPLKDLRVRRAIAAAVDNRLIVEKIMRGNAVPADQLFPPGVIGYDPSIELERPNLELAKKLLNEAGYPGGFTVCLDGTNDRYVNDAAILQAVASLLARAGIAVQVNAQPKASFFPLEERGGCSFFMLGWADTNGDGAGTFDHLLHTAAPGGGYGESNTSTQYSNPELDRLDEAASREFDPVKRNALLQAANRLAMHDLVHIPLHFQMDLYAVSNRIQWSPRRDTEVRGLDLKWADGEKGEVRRVK